jgi:carbohydrate diacid regulator
MAMGVSLQTAQQIVETLKMICDHDINFIDSDGKICASTDGTRIGGYHEGGHQAAISGQSVTIERDDPARELRWGINMPIKYNGRIAAVIGITGRPEEVRKYADLAQRITLLLLREQDLAARNNDARNQTGFLVRALIDNETVSSTFTEDVLTMNGLTSEPSQWRTVVFRLKTKHSRPLHEIETALRNTIGRLGGCLHTYQFPDEYIVILPQNGFDKKERLLSALAESYPDALQIGVGPIHRLTRQYRSCQGARLALKCLSAGENFAKYDDKLLELLLADVGRDAADDYIHRCLDKLDDEDKALLDVYYACDMSLQKTAERCFVHKNTMQYRLNRIEDRCGLDPRRFRDAAALYTALRIEKLR